MIKSTLWAIIQHNAETKPKPHHHNRDLMTTLLMLEVQDEREH